MTALAMYKRDSFPTNHFWCTSGYLKKHVTCDDREIKQMGSTVVYLLLAVDNLSPPFLTFD